MGKKKKGGKKGGKKGKKGGKKGKEPQMTAKEAILAYQINVIEKKLEDVMYETRGWEEKNKRSDERNGKLKSEQGMLIQHLLKQSKESEKLFENEEIKTKDHVVTAMKSKWMREKERQKGIQDLKAEIRKLESEIEKVQKEVDYWIAYKNEGQKEHQKQIKVLQQDINDMTTSFNEMKAHLEGTLNETKDEIQRLTDEKLDQHKHNATEKAIHQMDKYSRQEVLDNDWLRREVEIHRRDTEDLKKDVEEMERQNLEIMADLFECKIEDLKISRQFYLSQFADNENLEETGILEMDLAQLSVEKPKDKLLAIEAKTRPKSAVQRAIEDKVFSLVTASVQSEDESSADESVDTDLLDNMYFEEEDWSDYLQLGPLELKLLNVTGEQMPIHVPLQLTEEELEAKKCNPEQWPVTLPMIKDVSTPRA
ncbi:hypothetical protein ACJMK2_027738 [Sinanodonta woodiana]|uniref:Coiled-coil domain-containing protein 83-like n=1 Tax=Sinanodonta woodiana TaxID=1069815 RepID=A0ABD3X715_SINWO